MKFIKTLPLILFFYLIVSTTLFGQEKVKWAQSGMQYLSIPTDAKAAAFGRAVTTIALQSSSLFYNPALLTYQENTVDVSLSLNKWIADISHNAFTASYRPGNGEYGVFGVSFMSVDYGEIQGAIRANNEQGYIKTSIIKPSAFTVGLGYAFTLTDKFAIGGQIKIVKQDLGESVIPSTDSTNKSIENSLMPVAFDFGTIYKTGFKSLIFGMFVRNFSTEAKYVSEGFQLPLEFSIGVSMNLFDFVENLYDHSLIVSIDAVHYRARPEQIYAGLEYQFKNIIALRGGYSSNNSESNMSFGLGIQFLSLTFDYAYTPFGFFNNVQRFTFRFSL